MVDENAKFGMEISQLNEHSQRMEDILAKALGEVERLKQQVTQLEKTLSPAKRAASITTVIESRDANKIGPADCQQVQQNGHQLSGFYMVQDVNTGKIGTLYCNFGQTPGTAGYETVVGYNDVKTSSGVYFHVSRTSGFLSIGSIIPFQVERVNIGNAMNTATGVFTAPKAGIYTFSFSATVSVNLSTVYMQLNGNVILSGYGYTAGSNIPLTATLRLKAGDTVTNFLNGGSLNDDIQGQTYFTGFLLEEDI